MELIHIATFTALIVNIALALFMFAKAKKWRAIDLHSLRETIKDDMASHERKLKDHQQQLDRQHEKIARVWANVFAPNRVRPAPFPGAPEQAPGFVERSRVEPRKPGDRRSTAKIDAQRDAVLSRMPPADTNPIFGADFAIEPELRPHGDISYIADAIRTGKMKTVGGWDNKDYGKVDKIISTDDGGWELASKSGAGATIARTPAPFPPSDFLT